MAGAHDEYEGWKETQAIRSDPEMMAEIRRGLRALKRGGKIDTLGDHLVDLPRLLEEGGILGRLLDEGGPLRHDGRG